MNILYRKAMLMLDQLEEVCKTHHNFYEDIMDLDTFNDTNIADALYNIVDESYAYLIKHVFLYIKDIDSYNLYNVFSGSGRLVKELLKNEYIDCFDCIFNIDSSKSMIDYEKKAFRNLEKVKYLCTDFLSFTCNDSKDKIIVCHCGVRYVLDKVDIFAKKIKSMLTCNSVCLITETNVCIINQTIEKLMQEGLKCKLFEEKLFLHQNTRLYLAFALYKKNNCFMNLINQLSEIMHKEYKDTLIGLAGYKSETMYIICAYI